MFLPPRLCTFYGPKDNWYLDAMIEIEERVLSFDLLELFDDNKTQTPIDVGFD